MPPARDSFLDGLRSVSILRVVLLHLLLWVEHPWIATFSFFMPGMALVFFVSGALASRSLRENGWEERRRLWRDRARRLFAPFWAYALVVAGTGLALDLALAGPLYDMPAHKAWCWILPLGVPEASPLLARLVWHLWFLSALILLIGSAPWTLALHRRRPFLVACVFAAGGVALELSGVRVPQVLTQTLLFGTAFLLGYGYSDGTWQKLRPSVFLAAALCLGALAIASHARLAQGTMIHTLPLAYVALGLAFVSLWLALRGPASKLFERPAFQRASRAINARAYSLYLWGPVANEVSWRVLEAYPAGGLVQYFTLAIAGLLVLVKLFGRIEDWAAGRGRMFSFASRRAERARQAA